MATIFGEIERLISEHGSAAVLRERLGLAADQYAALERKNAELEAENGKLQQEVGQLRHKVAELQTSIPMAGDRPEGFTEDTDRVLALFFKLSDDVLVDQVAGRTRIDRSMIEYHFDLLCEAGFIIQTRIGIETYGGSSPCMYGITPEGRKFVVKHGIQQ